MSKTIIGAHKTRCKPGGFVEGKFTQAAKRTMAYNNAREIREAADATLRKWGRAPLAR